MRSASSLVHSRSSRRSLSKPPCGSRAIATESWQPLWAGSVPFSHKARTRRRRSSSEGRRGSSSQHRGYKEEVRIQDEDAPAYFSTVCDTHVRLWQPDTGRPPRFQWLDAKQNRWRDREADTEFELREREAIGEMKNAIKTMYGLLDGVLPLAQRDRIAEAWHRHGLPDDAVARLLAVRDAPAAWHDLLEPNPDTRTDRDDRPSPRDW